MVFDLARLGTRTPGQRCPPCPQRLITPQFHLGLRTAVLHCCVKTSWTLRSFCTCVTRVLFLSIPRPFPCLHGPHFRGDDALQLHLVPAATCVALPVHARHIPNQVKVQFAKPSRWKLWIHAHVLHHVVADGTCSTVRLVSASYVIWFSTLRQAMVPSMPAST